MTKKSTVASDWRKETGLNQHAFWTRYGVSQSSASRYENGREPPLPLLLLMTLHRMRRFGDSELAEARGWLEQQAALPFLAWRQDDGLTQGIFWKRYGVTQSGGSRYESGRASPMPLCLLMRLHRQQRFSSADLEAAQRVLKWNYVSHTSPAMVAGSVGPDTVPAKRMASEAIGPGHVMYGIRVMTPKGRGPGYLVKIERRKVDHTKWFGFALYGGQFEALAAAQVWRDEQTCQLAPLTKQEFVSQIRTNNSSGAAGVVRATQRSKKRSGQFWSADYWIARPPRGIKVSARYFSISRHGEEGARALAFAARQEMEMLCSGYHAPHVPEAFQLGAFEEVTVGSFRQKHSRKPASGRQTSES
jgi:transcriptional regulator with XRE-family HTH domain